MIRLYLIRHAKPGPTNSEVHDPGLDPIGVLQAQSTARLLTAALTTALPVYTSPLRRCRETAEPLEQRWQCRAQPLTQVAEIPAPPFEPREPWLQRAMTSTWSQLRQQSQSGWPDYREWRNTLLTCITALREDSVIFSHFIAINVLVGTVLGDDRVVCFRPDHASITVLAVEHGKLRIVELGREAARTQMLARN